MSLEKLPLVALASLAFALGGCNTLFPDPVFGDDDDLIGDDDDDDSTADAVDPCEGIQGTATGDINASADQSLGLQRLNCYRQLSGVPEAAFHPALNDAAQSHNDYVVATDEFSHDETDNSHPDFTGAGPYDRADAAGYNISDNDEYIFEVLAFWSSGANPARAVDEWMLTVYHRAPLMQPLVDAVGVGSGGQFDTQLVAAPLNLNPGSQIQVAFYPADGQEGVVRSWDSDTEIPDPAPDQGFVGQPITATFIAEGWTNSLNPHAAFVDFASLAGPNGEVDVLVLEPATDGFLFRTVALVPTSPLDPQTDYDVALDVEVDGQLLTWEWSFRTGD